MRATTPSGQSVDLAGAAASDPRVSAFVAAHAVRSAKPLLRAHARQAAKSGLSGAQIAEKSRERFPARAARVPASVKAPDLTGIYVLELEGRSTSELGQALDALRRDPMVEYAEEDRVVKVTYTPNDPYFATPDDLYGLKKIGCIQAWDTARGNGVIVAVVDTGVDYSHPDIAGNIWTNPGEIPGNGLDDDQNGYVDDVRGWDFIGQNWAEPAPDNDPYDGYNHGTHVAGTIAAVGNNALGVVGVAMQAKIMPVKGLADDGFGLDSTLTSAVIYAADEGADVINASWGRTGTSQLYQDAVAYAHALGVVFVAAAGNDSQDAGNFTPANIPKAISVGATDASDNKAPFSNTGSKIDVVAPGVEVLSLQYGGTDYFRLSGTSMAAPHVSGVAALVIGARPTFSNEQIRQVLRSTAVDLSPVGKDLTFGYGRVNAAQAVLATQALAAKIYTPFDGTAISAPIALSGTAQGTGFTSYVVEYGSGESPTSWTTFHTAATSVANGQLAVFNPATLPDGLYTIRLRVMGGGGATYRDQIQIRVAYLEIASPAPSLVPPLTTMVKSGASVPVLGRAKGPSFQNYRLEWAPGRNATSGWSTVGVTLVSNGTASVENGLLGTWNPSPSLIGEYTIRLVVTNSGFTSQRTTSVYFEPSLVANAWPLFAGATNLGESMIPAKLANGTTRLILCNALQTGGSSIRSYTSDGSAIVQGLDQGSLYQPSVGDVDGQPGEEVVVADRFALKIMTPTLSLIRTITTGQTEIFGIDFTTLADLNGDGTQEIIALARGSDPSGQAYASTGRLYVFRGDGQLYGTEYPRQIVSPLTPIGYSNVVAGAIDLNQDGQKEIVLAVTNLDGSGYSLLAYKADGTPYVPWSVPAVSAYAFTLAMVDLDHDGKRQIAVLEIQGDNTLVRVLNSSGVVRPGWPVTAPGGWSAIAAGDLDGDQRDEIVVSTNQSLSVFKPNGAPASGWPVFGGAFFTPVIVDIDNNGSPEIVSAHNVPVWDAVPYTDLSLIAYGSNATIVREWPLLGHSGRQAFQGVTAVGEFTGDGHTDLAVHLSLIEGGGMNGLLQYGALQLLTTGTPFNAAKSPWLMNYRDPQNSRAQSLPTSQPGAVVALPGGPWINTPIPAQTGTFTVRFDAIPSAASTDAVVALALGSPSSYAGLAAIVRFNPSGRIDARNGNNYTAASVIPYAANQTYRFRMVVNVPAHTYSAYVTPPGGSEVTIGSNYAFRAEQASVASLNTWSTFVASSAPGTSLTVHSFLLFGPVINETFSTSPAAHMTVVSGGTWSVSGGKYVLTNPAEGTTGNGNIAVHNTGVSGDFTLTVDASTTASSSTWNDVSVLFGYQNSTNYYFVSLNENNDGATSGIFKVVNGVQTQLADITALITAGTTYAIKVVKTGHTYKAYRNNVLVATATDSTWSSGKVGCGTRNDGASFDNLVVVQQ